MKMSISSQPEQKHKGFTRQNNRKTLTSFAIRTQMIDIDSALESAKMPEEEQKIAFVTTTRQLPYLTSEYEVGKVFAEGGQGIIREGKDLTLKRLVAIKTLKKEVEKEDPNTRPMFLQEASITAQLCHPSIIPIYSLNTDEDDGLHITMKKIEGMTLKSYLEKVCVQYRQEGVDTFDERKSLLFRLEVFLKVCDGLDYAHNRGIIHCDLKPENIIIGKFHETYVMDWGIAREINEPGYDPATWKSPTMIAGTPRFLSPEAILGKHTDQRADLYTMGLILFEIVTLQEAYMGTTNEEVLALIRTGRIAETVHRFGYKIDADLKAIIAKATAFNREERYQHISELSADLRKYLAGEETSANPYMLSRKLIAFAGHHRRITLASSISLVLLLVLTVSYTVVSEVKRIASINKMEHFQKQCFSGTEDTATYIETSMAESMFCLSSLMAEYLFLDGCAPNGTKELSTREFVSEQDLSANSGTKYEEQALYSSVYHRKVDFAHFAYKTPDCSKPTQADRVILERLGQLHPMCLKSFYSQIPKEAGCDTEEKKNEYLRLAGLPFHNILFGFENGLFAILPGRGDYADDYDPRKRTWYSTALEKEGQMVWSLPYPGATLEAGYLITCGMAMYDLQGKFIGVIGIDIRLKGILEHLNVYGNKGSQVYDKTLMTSDGTIIVSTGKAFQEATSDPTRKEALKLMYQDQGMFMQMKQQKCGVLRKEVLVEHKDQTTSREEHLFCYYYLPSQDWYYIEEIKNMK